MGFQKRCKEMMGSYPKAIDTSIEDLAEKSPETIDDLSIDHRSISIAFQSWTILLPLFSA